MILTIIKEENVYEHNISSYSNIHNTSHTNLNISCTSTNNLNLLNTSHNNNTNNNTTNNNILPTTILTSSFANLDTIS